MLDAGSVYFGCQEVPSKHLVTQGFGSDWYSDHLMDARAGEA
jgi:hypothetical protein